MKQWVQGLRLPWGELNASQGRLGAAVRQITGRGVKIVGLLPDSPAESAGLLKVGDYIVKFDGKDIRNPAEYVAAVRAAGAMRTITIEVLRNGRRKTIAQTLSAGGR